MQLPYSLCELALYVYLYAFLFWALQVLYIAVRDRRFVNRGFLNLPLSLPGGLCAVILMLTLPTLEQRYILQYAMTFAVCCIVWRLSEHYVRSVSRKSRLVYHRAAFLPGLTSLLPSLVIAGLYLVVYLFIHPLLLLAVSLAPVWLIRLLALCFTCLTALDYLCVRYALHSDSSMQLQAGTQRLADRMSEAIWLRLQKAYPGIEADDADENAYTFAQGLCLDKLIWVFLASSFLGALIEMLYCRVTGGVWMSRSSVLYGPFSVVWGLGAVLLTVVLQRLESRSIFAVFAAGFFVGGAYEYLCSVFTELLFGTVFWDYSHMPMSIGGRTNVLYCVFWGLLALLWLKALYPPLSRGIERIPALPGKIVTWVLVFLMGVNALLTAGAMARYTQRQSAPESGGRIAAYLDAHYDDAFMENRWPNMRLTQNASD